MKKQKNNMEYLTRARTWIYIKFLISLIFIVCIVEYITSCFGLGPCIYTNIWNGSEYLQYSDSKVIFDISGINPICKYNKNNIESRGFEIKTIRGDELSFNIYLTYEIDGSFISKDDLYKFNNGFGLLKNENAISYVFSSDLPDFKCTDKSGYIEDCILKSFLEYHRGIPCFVKNLIIKVELVKIDIN